MYSQVPIKRVGPNKQVGWILLNTFVCLCVCFFLHVSLVPNQRVYSSIWHPRVHSFCFISNCLNKQQFSSLLLLIKQNGKKKSIKNYVIPMAYLFKIIA